MASNDDPTIAAAAADVAVVDLCILRLLFVGFTFPDRREKNVRILS
jgi:hypothetical protein